LNILLKVLISWALVMVGTGGLVSGGVVWVVVYVVVIIVVWVVQFFPKM
jgi:hypothetical protein